jgi:hypothetical protein
MADSTMDELTVDHLKSTIHERKALMTFFLGCVRRFCAQTDEARSLSEFRKGDLIGIL